VSVEDVVKDFIATEIVAPSGREVGELGPDTSLFRTGVVDSFGLFTLSSFLEDRFGIAVGDEDLVPENFDSIARIARFVATKGGVAPVDQA
jgi:acyl carrier protein